VDSDSLVGIPMTSEATRQSLIDAGVLSLLACPVCRGELRVEAAGLVCVGCGRGYPVVDGIPVLIAERAETREER
jgi:uncharacterized protein YbaR (Trm112 family)